VIWVIVFGLFFKIAKDKCMDPYPLEHYTNEARHVLHLLDQCLEGRDYLIHEGYTIADMAILPRVYALEEVFKASEYLGLHNFPNVMAWKACCMEQPATAKGLTTGKRL
jgi:glutathione S-transferase